ncbi:response regulator [Desulfurivibrio alkaliphilus]|uniref:Response regulator receiver protein n=1 Tax=Desulfurivibrio alkaliphilus (strain DSM 19089 / UNIQEM U267 / AHT2) TaxID=589865 RepID=D6Z1W4_DESAT|nr:response regulator [Desulfurivibrio alkaliphilus]ADH85539.1 response regulator receiver protein [Desulfurivibrio alkaliphilus AHT 2]
MAKKLLVVDDSPVSRSIIKKCLPKGHDFELYEADDGRQGLEKFQEVRPDATLLDLTMPVMDGFEALAEIKKVDPDALVIVLTADIQPKAYEKVMALGAAMVIPKPPSPETLADGLAKTGLI